MLLSTQDIDAGPSHTDTQPSTSHTDSQHAQVVWLTTDDHGGEIEISSHDSPNVDQTQVCDNAQCQLHVVP